MVRKIKSLDDIWWKSINLPPTEIMKILDGTKTNFITRERYGKRFPKRRFWKDDYVFVRERWHPDFFKEDSFIYEVGTEKSHEYVNWNPPQQMPREAGRIFVKIIKVERKHIWDLNLREIKGTGFKNELDFMAAWDIDHWKDGDRQEFNPMVRVHKFKRIQIKKYGDGTVIRPRD